MHGFMRSGAARQHICIESREQRKVSSTREKLRAYEYSLTYDHDVINCECHDTYLTNNESKRTIFFIWGKVGKKENVPAARCFLAVRVSDTVLL